MTELVAAVCEIAKLAGDAILEVYDSDDFGVEEKTDDVGYRSPLTKADTAAHDIIVKYLKELTPDVPILSEEGDEISYDSRKGWEVFWCVDPLDGTKEFVKRNGEFTVNIALIQDKVPVLGVIYVPVTGKWYYADEDGAYTAQGDTAVELGYPVKSGNVVASKSHIDDASKAYIAKKGYANIISVGSSLKFCMVAEGKADAYVRAGPTMEWDTAAGHAIILAVGKTMSVFGTKDSFTYNKENLRNPGFIVE